MFASSRNHDQSLFAQVLRQQQPRRRRPERTASSSSPPKSIPGLLITAALAAPTIPSPAKIAPDQTPNLPTTAALIVHSLSNTVLSTLEASAAGGTATIPPSPPSSTPGSQSPRPQPWATRSRRSSHPAILSKRRAFHGVDTLASGAASMSAPRPTKRSWMIEPGTVRARINAVVARPNKAGILASGLPGPTKRDGCKLCSNPINNQPRKQCQTYSNVYFCLKCAINSAVLHPGHEFELVEPSGKPSIQQNGYKSRNQLALSRSSIRSGTVSSQAQSDESRGTPSREMQAEVDDEVEEGFPGHTSGEVDDEEARQMLRTVMQIPLCKACKTKLFDLRYECQDCPDTNFCSSCRLLYNPYTLKLVTSLIIISSWDNSDEDGEVTNNASSTHDRTDKDSDASIHPEPDGGGENAEYSIEHANIKYISNDHGRGETDKGVSSSTKNIINSKECRPIKLRSRARKSPVQQPKIPFKNFSQIARTMTKAMKRMQAVVRATEDIMRIQTRQNLSQRGVPKTHDSKRSRSTARKLPVPEALLDFLINLATLDYDDNDDEESEDEGRDDESGSSSRICLRPRKRIRQRPRQWSSKDQRRLAQLKQKGWKDDRIGADLGRSAGAVLQQWRKQKLPKR